jgi:hypothetical protein
MGPLTLQGITPATHQVRRSSKPSETFIEA